MHVLLGLVLCPRRNFKRITVLVGPCVPAYNMHRPHTRRNLTSSIRQRLPDGFWLDSCVVLSGQDTNGTNWPSRTLACYTFTYTYFEGESGAGEDEERGYVHQSFEVECETQDCK